MAKNKENLTNRILPISCHYSRQTESNSRQTEFEYQVDQTFIMLIYSLETVSQHDKSFDF